MNRVLDSRSEGLRLDYQYLPCLEVCQANFTFHTTLVHQAVMGTWCTDPRLNVAACCQAVHGGLISVHI